MTHASTVTVSRRSSEPGFFQHRVAPAAAASEAALNEATRLMCAGAYLDAGYARAVVTELVEDEHRAIVPSTGFDVSPVLRHCFQANRMEVHRNAVLTAILAGTVVIAPGLTLLWLFLGMFIGVAAIFRGRTKRWGLWTAVAVVVLLCFFSGPILYVVLPLIPGPYRGLAQSAYPSDSPFLRGSLGVAFLLLCGAFVAQVYFRYRTYRVLTKPLSSGAVHKLPALPVGRAGRRVQAASAAQWGNLTLHGDRNPFLGAGAPVETWSMCVELKSRSQPGQPVQIDPVEMHGAVRAGLEAMRQSPLPENEKITGLFVTDHIVAGGLRRRDDVLLDPRTQTPFAEVTPEAINAIILHPQGSLRYYQRATVGADGKLIETPDHRVVAPAQDQEISVSAFLYLAVEGGMLYAEFVAAFLPPIRYSFRAFDLISPDVILGRAIRDVLPRVIPDFALAPFRLIRSMLGGGPGQRMEKADRRNREAYYYDYGARLSIRELAASGGPGTYLQRLDGQKYYKLIERSMTASMLEYLRSNDVDTKEYEERITEVHNHGVMITGGSVTGAVAAGSHATATSS